MLIKNAKGHTYNSEVPARYDSWLDYWEKNKGVKANACSQCRDEYVSSDLLGGHVRSCFTGNLYITPLCYGCNNYKNTELFDVYDFELVAV